MMAEFLPFKSKTKLSAERNLNNFIEHCREELTVFGDDLDWDNFKWAGVGGFTKLGTGKGGKGGTPMDAPFIDFAKASLRYKHGLQPSLSMTKYWLLGLRIIEAALLQMTGRAVLGDLTTAVLDEAAVLARRSFSKTRAYAAGNEARTIVEFLTKLSLVDVDIRNWKNPIECVQPAHTRTGGKAQAMADKRLPTEHTLMALAEIFSMNPSDPSDIFVTSTTALLMAAPSRITETLELPVDCAMPDVNKKMEPILGLRFYSGKGYEVDIKPVPTVLMDTTEEALRRIIVMTDSARKLALWIEEYPDQPYRHANCPKVKDDAPLTTEQACAYFGYTNPVAFRRQGLSSANGAHTLNSLWQWVMTKQPKGFPWLNKEKKIKYSNALFCMTRGLLGHPGIAASPLILWAPRSTNFNERLVTRQKSKRTIFERHHYVSTPEKTYRLTSHQIRHLLNTIANRGGASQEVIAKWSGRADLGQNAVYNHESEFELVTQAEKLGTSLTLYGQDGKVSQNVPVRKEEFDLVERGPVHLSLYGFCVHNFILAPCSKFRDCLNCEEHVCIKGLGNDNSERLARIKERHVEVEKDYTAAKEGLKRGDLGADRWVEYLEKTITRLRQLTEILQSDQVKDAQIKLRDGKDYSHERRVLLNKASIALANNAANAQSMADGTKLLGGAHG
ncbi:MAG: integrase [Rhodocyclaceae bacterium]|nr:MAG: integrase [Rhodocyclaceae bacterium]